MKEILGFFQEADFARVFLVLATACMALALSKAARKRLGIQDIFRKPLLIAVPVLLVLGVVATYFFPRGATQAITPTPAGISSNSCGGISTAGGSVSVDCSTGKTTANIFVLSLAEKYVAPLKGGATGHLELSQVAASYDAARRLSESQLLTNLVRKSGVGGSVLDGLNKATEKIFRDYAKNGLVAINQHVLGIVAQLNGVDTLLQGRMLNDTDSKEIASPLAAGDFASAYNVVLMVIAGRPDRVTTTRAKAEPVASRIGCQIHLKLKDGSVVVRNRPIVWSAYPRPFSSTGDGDGDASGGRIFISSDLRTESEQVIEFFVQRECAYGVLFGGDPMDEYGLSLSAIDKMQCHSAKVLRANGLSLSGDAVTRISALLLAEFKDAKTSEMLMENLRLCA
ncbi:MAG: hypothetical protein HY255_05100 [Betaproteobacteria bacterium]|nr:hypothetical protein [Betaproteobacteria bacterium]